MDFCHGTGKHECIILFLSLSPMYLVQSTSEIQLTALCIHMTVFLCFYCTCSITSKHKYEAILDINTINCFGQLFGSL